MEYVKFEISPKQGLVRSCEKFYGVTFNTKNPPSKKSKNLFHTNGHFNFESFSVKFALFLWVFGLITHFLYCNESQFFRITLHQIEFTYCYHFRNKFSLYLLTSHVLSTYTSFKLKKNESIKWLQAIHKSNNSHIKGIFILKILLTKVIFSSHCSPSRITMFIQIFPFSIFYVYLPFWWAYLYIIFNDFWQQYTFFFFIFWYFWRSHNNATSWMNESIEKKS